MQIDQTFPNKPIHGIVADGNHIYFVGDSVDGKLYAYQVDIGASGRTISLLWSQDLSYGIASAPQVVGKWLYLTTRDSALVAYNAATGGLRWRQGLTNVDVASPTLVYS